jgi:hypothetical protein
MDHPYTYIFIRKDLSLAQQLVQSSHAALEAGFTFNKPQQTSSIIMIGAKDQNELYQIGERLSKHGIKHHMFFEPDFDMGHSAIATEPIDNPQTRRLMRKYSLYKPTREQA